MKRSEFTLGGTFTCGDGLWRCMDIGMRTIAAIRIDTVDVEGSDGGRTLNHEEATADGWFNGPPYAVAEHGYEVCFFRRDELGELDVTPATPVVGGVGTVWASTLGGVREEGRLPVFLKPRSMSKLFNGRIVRNVADIDSLMGSREGFPPVTPEVNDGYSLGHGGLVADRYAELLRARWQELAASRPGYVTGQ